MAATLCTIIFNAKGTPTKCLSGKKTIEKAQADVAKMPGYSIKEVAKSRCPFCTPKTKEVGQDREAEPEAVTLREDEPETAKPGYCHACNDPGPFKLMFVNHVMVRECNKCGVWFDLHTCKPWGE